MAAAVHVDGCPGHVGGKVGGKEEAGPRNVGRPPGEVLKEVGYSTAEIDDLLSAGAAIQHGLP